MHMIKDGFYLNSINMQSFMKTLLVEKMNNSRIDAGTLITQTAVQSTRYKATAVVGEDMNIGILFLYHENIECDDILYIPENNKENGTGCMVYYRC